MPILKIDAVLKRAANEFMTSPDVTIGDAVSLSLKATFAQLKYDNPYTVDITRQVYKWLSKRCGYYADETCYEKLPKTRKLAAKFMALHFMACISNDDMFQYHI